MLVVSHQTALWLMISPAVSRSIRRRIRDRLGLSEYLPIEQINDVAASRAHEPTPRLEALTARQALELLDEDRALDLSPEKLQTVHYLVPRGASRRWKEGAKAHQWGGVLPQGSIIQVTKKLGVCSPEFCFLQMAATLNCAQLAQLGMALCGEYYPANTSRGFLDCPILTTPQRILDFLVRFAKSRGSRGGQGIRGFARAKRVARYLVAGARSPLEGSSVILMHVPRSMGGYGFATPALNASVRLSHEAARIFGRASIRPDIRFSRHHLSIECLGKAYHKHPDRDISRELTLRHDGDKVILFAYEQLVCQPQRTELMKTIARYIGKRIREMPPRFASRRAKLLEELFPSGGRKGIDGAQRYPKPVWALPAALATAA